VGENVPRNAAKSVELYQKACNGGNAIGCNDLGRMYSGGGEVKKDDGKAAEFSQKARVLSLRSR
jgi:hypothetical protein